MLRFLSSPKTKLTFQTLHLIKQLERFAFSLVGERDEGGWVTPWEPSLVIGFSASGGSSALYTQAPLPGGQPSQIPVLKEALRGTHCKEKGGFWTKNIHPLEQI